MHARLEQELPVCGLVQCNEQRVALYCAMSSVFTLSAVDSGETSLDMGTRQRG